MEIGALLERGLALLWRASWQASVLVLIVILFQTLLARRLTPLWRHAFWLLVVARLLLPVTPSSPWSLFNLWHLNPPKLTEVQTEPLGTPVVPVSEYLLSEDTIAGTTPEMPLAETALAPAKQESSKQVSREPWQAIFQSAVLSLQPYLGWIWFIGALVLGMRLAWGNYLFGLQLRRRHPIANDAVLALMDECRQVMGVRRPLTLLETPELESPALFGCFAIKLLLPERIIQTFSTEELRHVFLHELAHIRRRDTYMNWLTTILLMLHWFNPIIWFAFRRMRADRELACDAMVLAHTRDGEGKPYGQTVIKVLEGFAKAPAIPGLVGILEQKQEIKRRIRMITQFKKTSPWSVQAVVLVIALGLISLTDAQTKRGGEEPAETSGLEKGSQTDSNVASSATGSASELRANAKIAGSQAVSGSISANGDTLPGKSVVRSQATLHLIQEKEVGYYKRLSPDGLKMVSGSYDPNVIIVSDLSTGVERKYEQSAFYSAYTSPVWAPDGKRIAFLDGNTGTNHEDQRVSILTLDSGEVEKTDIRAFPCDWSRDGRFLLVIDVRFDETNEGVQLVDLKTGEAQTVDIHPFKWDRWFAPGLSPDGRYVVYNAREDEKNWDIFVRPIGSDKRVRITSHARGDWNPLWAADGKRILFMTNRELRGPDLYSVAFQNGKPMGEPENIVSDMAGSVELYSCSDSGSLLFSEKGDGQSDIYSTNIDPVSGSVLGDPDQLTHSKSWAFRPVWSLNGKYIAYFEGRKSGDLLLCVMNSDGRDQRTLGSVHLPFTSAWEAWKAWQPDNEHILYPGREADPENPEKTLDGIYSVSVRTHERKLIYHDPKFQGGMAVSPDGKHLALTSGSDEKPQLYIVDYDGQNRRQLVNSDGRIRKPSFTPDGQEIIYTVSVSAEGKEIRRSIMAVSIEGGEPREIYGSDDLNEGFDTRPSSWLPDGRFVFDIFYNDKVKVRAQYAINMDGKSEPVRISDHLGNTQSVSPDGTKALFEKYAIASTKLWLMSDFLPNGKLAMK